MPAQGMFGSGEIVITGGTFTQINQSHSDTGFTLLSQHISRGAIHDSVERYAAGRCHKGTREEIINTMVEWVNKPSPETEVLWLWGPAGAGKSSVLQTVSELLYKSHRTRYAGSFFFAKGVPGRGDSRSLFSTLAYQVACNLDGMRDAVNEAMTFDPLLPSKNMATQFDSLILHPLFNLPSISNHTPTIIIDGLDECQGSDDQRAILTLITKSLTASRRVPLRFIIASRPEHAIQDEFNRPALAALTERIELGHSRQTSQDIRKYLQEGFEEIYERNRDVMEHVAKPWPAVDRVNMFVRNASGQFVYASTVLKFIGSYSDYSDPQKQLEVISKPGPSRAEAFSPLDQLYTTILSNYPRRTELMHVLTGLFIKANLQTIVHCLDVSSGELKLVLRAISSLVKYPRSRVNIDNKELEATFGPLDQNPISFAHLSFRDFLQDKARSGDFWIDSKDVYSKLYNKLVDTFVTALKHGLKKQSYSRPKLVIPIAYDDSWGGYLYSTIPKNTSSPLVIRRLHDLQDALSEFLLDCNNSTSCHLEDLLQTMYAARKFTVSLSKNLLSIDADFTEISHKELVSQVQKVMDICFQRTISVERFIQTPNSPIFILGGDGSATLERILKCLDIPEARAVEFLKDNKHLIECDKKLVHYREQKLDVLTREYMSIQSVVAFLMDERRSVALHRSFRDAAIGTWRELVVRLVRVPDAPLSEDAHLFISEFLTKKALIRLRNKTDLGIMLPLFIELCELDWSTLNVVDGGDDVFLTVLNVLRFLHQTLNGPQSVALLTTAFHSTISTAMEKMYDALILRPTSTNYFCEVPLLSDDVVGIPPHNINPADDQQAGVQDYESVLTDNLNHLQEMVRGPESTKYKLPIDRVVMCTSILEFLLRVWATKFYQDSVCPIGRVVGLRCRFLFDHANPSEKIRLALRTLRDLDSKSKLKPNLPISIVASAQGFLERHQQEVDPQKDLLAWFHELKGRSIVRKEMHPDSDIPSDVESIEDDESDQTDDNHDDDHGYDIDNEVTEEQSESGLPEDEDFESIYAWGD